MTQENLNIERLSPEDVQKRLKASQEIVDEGLRLLVANRISVSSLSPQARDNQSCVRNGVQTQDEEKVSVELEKIEKASQEFLNEVLALLTKEVSTIQTQTHDSVKGLGRPFNFSDGMARAQGDLDALVALGMNPSVARSFLNVRVNKLMLEEGARTKHREEWKTDAEKSKNPRMIALLERLELVRHSLQGIEMDTRQFLSFKSVMPISPEEQTRLMGDQATLKQQINAAKAELPPSPTPAQIEAEKEKSAAEKSLRGMRESENISVKELKDFILSQIEGFSDAKKEAATKVIDDFNPVKKDGNQKSVDGVKKELESNDAFKDTGVDGFTVTEELAQKVLALSLAKKRDKAQETIDGAVKERAAAEKKIKDDEGKLQKITEGLSPAYQRIVHEEDINYGSPTYLDGNFVSPRIEAMNRQKKFLQAEEQDLLGQIEHELFCEKNPILGKITNFTRSAVDNVLKPTWQEAGKPLLSWSGEKGADALAWTVSKGVPGVVKWRGDRHTRKKDKMERKLEMEKIKTNIKEERQNRFKMSLIGKSISGIGSLAGLGARSTVNVGLAPINAVIGTVGLAASAADGVLNTAASLIGQDGKMNMGGKVKTIPWLRKNAANDNASKASNDNGGSAEAKSA